MRRIILASGVGAAAALFATGCSEQTPPSTTPQEKVNDAIADVQREVKDAGEKMGDVTQAANTELRASFDENLQRVDKQIDTLSVEMDELGETADARFTETWRDIKSQRQQIADKLSATGNDAKALTADGLAKLQTQLEKLADSVGKLSDEMKQETAG